MAAVERRWMTEAGSFLGAVGVLPIPSSRKAPIQEAFDQPRRMGRGIVRRLSRFRRRFALASSLGESRSRRK